jgi:hypothetical protein
VAFYLDPTDHLGMTAAAPLLFPLDPPEHLAKTLLLSNPRATVAHSGQVGSCGLKSSLLAEATMPYANGETPVLGDYVKNDLE